MIFSVLATRDSALVNGRGRFQINLFIFAFHNAGANLGGRFARFVLLIRVVKLLQASGAARAMGCFRERVES